MPQLTIQTSQLQYESHTFVVVVVGGGDGGGRRHAEIINGIVTTRIASLIIFIASLSGGL